MKDLPETGARFDESLPSEFVDVLLGEAAARGAVRFSARGPGHAVLSAQPLGPEDIPPVRFCGKVKAELSTTCVRCLEAVLLSVEAPIEATLFPETDPLAGVGQSGKRGPGKPIKVVGGDPLEPWAETFPDPDRLAEDAYDGIRLPLPQILQQALLIELPADPACADTVACDARTAELIASANADARASDAAGDPRWAALRALRQGANTNDDEPEGKD
ncbi:MAG: YceD family protein [Myxococcota bacterium]